MLISTKENLISVINPATEEIIFEIEKASSKEAKEKVEKARKSFLLWSSLSIEQRINYLRKLYDLIISERDHIANTITKNNGKPLAESYLTEIAAALQVMQYFIKKGTELLSKTTSKLD